MKIKINYQPQTPINTILNDQLEKKKDDDQMEKKERGKGAIIDTTRFLKIKGLSIIVFKFDPLIFNFLQIPNSNIIFIKLSINSIQDIFTRLQLN